MKNTSLLIILVLGLTFNFTSFNPLHNQAKAADVKPKYGPKDSPRAIPIGIMHEFLQSSHNTAPDFWALIGYYVPQRDDFSCSAAAVSMILNAAKLNAPKTADDKVISQNELLDKVQSENWKERLSKKGFNKSHGTSLDILGNIVLAAFKTYGFSQAAVKVVHVKDNSAGTKEELIKALKENEKSANDFILANFNQQAFTDDADAGHIAPVGAYDAKNDRVLILDPDRQYYEPYWVSLDTFLAGMNTLDNGAGQNRGYVWVKTGN